MSRRFWLLLGAIVLMVDAVQSVIAEAVTAAAWTHPPYSYAANFISDLGVPGCGAEFQGRTICSPLHSLMNGSFMTQGVLFAIGVVLVAGMLAGRARRVVVALAVLHGVAFVLVGLFHGSLEGPDVSLVIHIGAAAVGILCANTVVILAGALRGPGLPKAYRRFSIAVGILGIASEAGVNLSPGTAGLFERGGVYSWLLWGLVTGVLLLVRERRAAAVGQTVVV